MSCKHCEGLREVSTNGLRKLSMREGPGRASMSIPGHGQIYMKRQDILLQEGDAGCFLATGSGMKWWSGGNRYMTIPIIMMMAIITDNHGDE